MSLPLNGGHNIPTIAFGTTSLPTSNSPSSPVSPISTPQRSTKPNHSLEKLGVEYLDLFLVHNHFFVPDIKEAWKEMERLKEERLTRSIGVSNYEVKHLKQTMRVTKVKPAVNQISLNPYNYAEMKPIIDYCQENGIVVEAYSSLGCAGPVDIPITAAALRLGITPTQVIFLWVRAKGAVIVTTTSSKDRMKEYLAVNDLRADLRASSFVFLANRRGRVDFPPKPPPPPFHIISSFCPPSSSPLVITLTDTPHWLPFFPMPSSHLPVPLCATLIDTLHTFNPPQVLTHEEIAAIDHAGANGPPPGPSSQLESTSFLSSSSSFHLSPLSRISSSLSSWSSSPPKDAGVDLDVEKSPLVTTPTTATLTTTTTTTTPTRYRHPPTKLTLVGVISILLVSITFILGIVLVLMGLLC
ncbi:hypothetical protein D9758_013399 [Tetrapyrgos nigripes]|uniref:NADP-dependent oxidoreductase domain-containing protein n=1 Tax=Tetrapyrgos nigripes TaxID=182062 RepID=A0A8H5FNE3_9AGAR|nr:hypothetical protein D9758_013399 [Tetrapyrgos nigripes]